VVGDAAYGNEGLSQRQTLGVDEPPLCLHAWKLEFSHPVSGEAMSFTAAPPVWAS
jgi:23S rRNA-/tRNA-specific pseudouridylate synthase